MSSSYSWRTIFAICHILIVLAPISAWSQERNDSHKAPFGDRENISQGNQNEGAMLAKAQGYPDFGAAAKTLAGGLVGLAEPPLNVIGAALISLFWPTSGDATTEWQAVYDDLQKIVKNGLAEHDVKIASDKIQGYVNFLGTKYSSFKESNNTTKQKLSDLLSPYDLVFYEDIVDIFQYTSKSEEGLAAASFANFMTGATLHMGLNQELALVDPDAANPSSSAYAQTVSKLAETYSTYANKTAPYIKKQRLKQIGKMEVAVTDAPICPGIHDCIIEGYFHFTDHNTGKKYKYKYILNDSGYSPSEKSVDKRRAAYYQKISIRMDKTLQDQVYDVIAAWGELKDDPVPVAVDAALYWPQDNNNVDLFSGTHYSSFDAATGKMLSQLPIKGNWKADTTSFDAAFYWPQRKNVYLFSGSNYWVIDAQTKKLKYKKPIVGNWNLPKGWTRVDAALYLPEQKHIYLVNGSNYVAMDPDTGKILYQDPIVGNWNLPKGWATIDAFAYWPSSEKSVLIFHGTEYIAIDPVGLKREPDYPRTTSSMDWDGRRF